MSKSFRLLLTLSLIWGLSPHLFAEVFELTSGKVVEGEVITEDDEFLYVEDATGAVMQVPKKKLDKEKEALKPVAHVRPRQIPEKLIRQPPENRHPNKLYLYGYVTQKHGEPLEGVEVSAHDAKGWEISKDWTREDGSYMMDMTKVGLQANPIKQVKAVWKAGGDEIIQDLEVTSDTELPFKFETASLFRLSGQVIGSDGEPASKAHVTLKDKFGKGLATETADEQGRFKVTAAKEIASLHVVHSEASGHMNSKKFPGPYESTQQLELKLDPLPLDEFVPGTVVEVGEEMGEVHVIPPGGKE